MKSAFSLVLLLSLLLFGSTLSARDITVMYYPVGSTASLLIAFSPDATNSSPVSNPTFELLPNTTLNFRIKDNTRFWWYTSAHGWLFEPYTAPSDETCRDVVLYFGASGGNFVDYLDPATSSSAPPAPVLTSDDMEIFKLGFWFVVSCGLFIVILGLARMISSQDHRP